jgi:predicted ATPase
LKQLGDLLTGDRRQRIVTLHGSGGQGKTALAREAVERFAYAWPGGVLATTLGNLPGREMFVSDLARFLGIPTQELHDPAEVERQVLRQLNQRRTLIVLDNAETLIEAVRAGNGEVTLLTQFIQQLPGPTVSLLVTSREHLGWSGEVAQEIGGLSSEEGANLFRQSAPQRANEVEMTLAK